MSSNEERDGSALEHFSHVQGELADVSRAFDSLLEAKHVLQRIENKVNIRNQRRRQAPKVRRRLQLERNSLSGLDSYSSAIGDSSHLERQQTYEWKPDETFTLHSDINSSPKPRDLSSRTRTISFLQEDIPSVVRYHQYHTGFTHEHLLAESVQENIDNGQVMALRGSSEEHVDHVLKPYDLGVQTYTPEDEMDEIVNPYAGTFPLSGIFAKPEIGPCLSPETITPLPFLKDDLNAQKLEHLRIRSPESKLEKLKEKIQEQKRRHDLLKRSKTKSHQNPEPLRKPAMKRKVCKVTFGPPAACGREFIPANEGSDPVCNGGDAFKRERENVKKKPHRKEGDTALRCSIIKSKAIKSKSPVTTKPSDKSPTPERKVKHSGLYGASAWREGQKLVQQILGPSPVTLLKHRSPKAEDSNTMQKGSCRRCQKTSSSDNQKQKQQPNLNDLVKQNKDIAQVTPEIRPEEDREKSRDSNRLKRPHTSYNIKRRPHPSCNMERNPFGKENVEADPESHPISSRARSYSVEQIRDFMKKKTIERQRMERETQTRMEKAMEMRKEQLGNVLKKQKEACPPKRGGCTTVSRRNLHIQPGEADIVRKELSEWLHGTSSDLLREGCGVSGNSKKQKTEILLKDDHSSPLRLQDLAPVPALRQDIHLKGISPSEGLNHDAVPSHKTTDFSSQCRAHQERLHAIWTTAKDLGRRVELECNRLSSPNLGQHSGTSVSSPSPCSPSQMTSAFGKYPIMVENITFKTDKNLKTNTRKPPEDILPASVYTDLCWTPDSAKFSTAPLKNTRRHSMKKEKTAAQTKDLHPKIHSKEAQKSRSASTSPHRLDVSRSKVLRETSLSPPRQRMASPPKTTPTNNDKKAKRGKPQHEKSSSPVFQIEMTSRIKAQLQQHENDLAALKQKAEMEAKEAQTCLEEMLRRNKQSPGHKTISPEKQNLWNNSGGQEREKDSFGAGMKTRMELDKHGSGNVTQQNSPLSAHVNAAPAETGSLENSWDHTEPATDSTSKWSELCEFYGSPNMFARFTLEMSQQYLREEELRARHQTALLRLREEALKEKTKAELSLLNHQKIYWETKKEPSKIEEILKQEQEIQRGLKEEQAEIRHLQNMYKAAHQERKLLLRQQKEILRIQQSAAHIQQKLNNSGATLQVSELVAPDPFMQSRYNSLHDSTLNSGRPDQDTQSAISDLSEDGDITRNTRTTDTYHFSLIRAQRSEDESKSPVPEVCENSALRRSDPQSREEKVDTISDNDGEAQGISLWGDEKHVTGSLQNNLTSPTSPTSREDLSNHSEKEISANNTVKTFVNMQDTDGVTAGEPRNNISLKDEDKKREVAEVDSSEDFQQDPHKIPATQEASGDDHLVTKPITDHSSQNNSAPSKSETLIQDPSLAEFQKVSAKLINISESTISASEQGQGGEDTESGDSEIFDIESLEFPPEGPLDKVWGENILNQDEEIKGDTICDEDKPTSSPAKSPGLRKPVILVMKETQSKAEMAPLACESFPTSEDLTESDTKTYGINHLPENQDGSLVRINDIQKLTSMSPEDDGNAAGMSSPDTKDQERVTETNEKQSFTESAIFRKTEMMPFHATTSKDLFQIKSLPHRNKGDIIFITVDDLQPMEDVLSEILSPVDEKLSYESADLYSPQQDHSEELPSFPRDSDSIKSGDSGTEDFPTPPEEMLLSQSESLQSSREASLIEEIHLLYDSLLTEDTLLPPDEIINTENSLLEAENSGRSPEVANSKNSLLEAENSRRSPEVVKPCRPFLTLSKAEDGVSDPLSTFEIGDRVLVKLSKPGTLMYKGLTNFKAGYWAGVALDKPEGEHDGTYEGIRYFECSKNCGVFVRPGQISHLLFDDLDGSDPKKDEDDDNSYGDGTSPSDVQPHEDGGDTSRRQLQESSEEKESLVKDTRQSRSCSLETSANIYDLQDADISPSYLHTLLEEHIVESKNPGQTLQIKQFWRGDTNKLIVPNPPQNNKHRLLLKVTDELICSALCDAIATYSKISAPKKESVMNSSKDKDDKCMEAEEGFCNQLPSMTTAEAGGYVDMIVTDLTSDCVNEYKKIRQKKGGENIHQPSICYSSLFLGPREQNTSISQCGHRRSVLMNFTDRIFEELVKDSLQVIGNINVNRAKYWPAP
ncbi:coiled-coil domain-containing protein 187 [Hyla sarda]|uniref:coiled-coil domain-containing protein 187 n=1 Tax=Hyla sarda TaxID=327740 RepID=UPI0024C29158|nr:coiled-coil domain-containing protein 187 [Hyla sarda]